MNTWWNWSAICELDTTRRTAHNQKNFWSFLGIKTDALESGSSIFTSYIKRQTPTYHLTKNKRHGGITSKGRPLNSHKHMKYLCFTENLTALIPQFPPSSYQNKLHKRILELQKSGLGYRKIAYWLNDNGYKTPRGHSFKSGHVYSILKKRRLRDEKYSQAPEIEVRGVRLKTKR